MEMVVRTKKPPPRRGSRVLSAPVAAVVALATLTVTLDKTSRAIALTHMRTITRLKTSNPFDIAGYRRLLAFRRVAAHSPKM